jgi:subtilisin family serine protease
VSGVAVGRGNNSLGTTGAAYGARVMPVKVADASGFASDSVLANAIKLRLDEGGRH